MNNSFRLLFILAGIFSAQAASAQTEQPIKVLWYTLSSVPFDGVYKPNDTPPLPIFPESVKKLDGKLIAIDGYTIPLDPSGVQITLSANPFAACFFCGKAGPASIMVVLFDEAQKGLKTDDYIYLTGRLRLNSTDPYQPYYTLEHAVLVKKK